MESVEQFIGALPQSASSAELDQGHRHVQGVDEIGVQELPNRVRSTTEPDVLTLGGRSGLLKAVAGSASTK